MSMSVIHMTVIDQCPKKEPGEQNIRELKRVKNISRGQHHVPRGID